MFLSVSFPYTRFIFVGFLLCFASSLPAQARILSSNFIAPPAAQAVTMTDPFTKTMNIGDLVVKVSCTGWQRLGRNGSQIENGLVRLDTTERQNSASICQTITFDPPIQIPIAFSAKCKGDLPKLLNRCSIYLEGVYNDGSPFKSLAVDFAPSQYDFKEGNNAFFPVKPVKSIKVFLHVGKSRGTVWFDNIHVGPLPFLLARFQAVGGLFGRGSAAVVMRSNIVDRDARFDLNIAGPDGTSLFSRTLDGPLCFFTPADDKPISLKLTGQAELRGEKAVVMETIDTTPCDNGRDYCVWTTTSMERIFPYSLPRLPSDHGGATYSDLNDPEEKLELRKRLQHPSASIELACNEYESFQIGILSPTPLKDVEIKLSDLISTTDTKTKIDSKHLDWKQVGFVRADRIRKHPADTEGIDGWWPDPLLPAERFDVAVGLTQPVWITVYAPKTTKPGTYRGTVSIVPTNGTRTDIPLSVKVWNIELADEGHFQTAFAFMDGFLEKVYSIKPTTPELRKRYGDFLLKHRLTPEGDISRTALPVIEELEYYRGRGLGMFSLLNMVQERGDRMWRSNSPVDVYTPEFKANILNRLKPFIAELRQRGLSDKAYIYTFDERTADYAEVMSEYFGMIKEHFPEVKTFTTSYFAHKLETMRKMNLDWACSITSRYNFEEAEECRADGRQVWSYISCSPDYPYANIMFRFPLIEARLLFWQSYHEKFDGLLYWTVNYWTRKENIPIDPKKGPFLDWTVFLGLDGGVYGDGHLLYAGIDGQPIGSIRLANIRDGLEDYEYLYQVRQKNEGNWDKAREFCREIVPCLTVFSRNPSDLYRQRRAVVRELLGDER